MVTKRRPAGNDLVVKLRIRKPFSDLRKKMAPERVKRNKDAAQRALDAMTAKRRPAGKAKHRKACRSLLPAAHGMRGDCDCGVFAAGPLHSFVVRTPHGTVGRVHGDPNMSRRSRDALHEIMDAAACQLRGPQLRKPPTTVKTTLDEFARMVETIASLQGRLDAMVVALDSHRPLGGVTPDMAAMYVLARGTPARELRACLKRWAKEGKK